MRRMRRAALSFAMLASMAAFAAAQPVPDIEARALQLGVDAGTRARAEPATAEAVIAERYTQALAMSEDAAVQARIKEAFRRGYQSVLGGGTSASTAAERAAMSGRIFDVTMARGVGSDGPVRATDEFTPVENPFYVWYRHDGLAPGITITSDWYFDEPTPPVRITQGRATVGAAGNSGHFSFELAPGKQWPVGRYHVALRAEGSATAEVRFRVVPSGKPSSASTPTSPAPRPWVHPRFGYEVTPPPGWAVNDQAGMADVRLSDPSGRGVIEIASGPAGMRLDPASYAAGWESVSVGPGRRLRAKRAGTAATHGGEMAYTAVYEGDGVLVKVLFVGIPTHFWVLTGAFEVEAFSDGEPAFDRLVTSLKMQPPPR